MSRVYCSDASRLRGDDNTATAARIDIWILVEYPGTWGHDPIRDAALSQPVSSALKRACKDIPRSRVVFIRRRLETRTGNRVYIVRSSPHVSQTMIELDAIEDIANVPFSALSTQHSAPSFSVPLVLVCTHGQHDSCCGRRGFPLYDALRCRDDLDVWQCSHIGGDRFAANAVVLPWGIYYGPVEARESDVLADSVLRGDIHLPAYRGRSSMSRVEQAAETFVRRATGILALSALHIQSRESLGAERTRVHLTDSTGCEYNVTVEQFAIKEALLTCTAASTNPIPQFRLIDLEVR